MDNAIQTFNQKHMEAFIELKALTEQKKALDERDQEIRGILAKEMEDLGIESIDNDYVKISFIPASESVKLDEKTFRAEKPAVYKKWFDQYNKRTFRKGYTRITVK